MSGPLRVGLAGLGTVGGGVAAVLLSNGDLLASRAGRSLVLTAVSARDAKKNRDISLSGVAFESNPLALAERNDVDVVVELIGGEAGAAKELVESALKRGKHVVTANKALLAHHGAALAALAEIGRAHV